MFSKEIDPSLPEIQPSHYITMKLYLWNLFSINKHEDMDYMIKNITRPNAEMDAVRYVLLDNINIARVMIAAYIDLRNYRNNDLSTIRIIHLPGYNQHMVFLFSLLNKYQFIRDKLCKIINTVIKYRKLQGKLKNPSSICVFGFYCNICGKYKLSMDSSCSKKHLAETHFSGVKESYDTCFDCSGYKGNLHTFVNKDNACIICNSNYANKDIAREEISEHLNSNHLNKPEYNWIIEKTRQQFKSIEERAKKYNMPLQDFLQYECLVEIASDEYKEAEKLYLQMATG